MSLDKKSSSSENKNISIGGDVVDSAVFIGDNNTVNQTFFQKVINIFKSDSETLEHRNRRILLGHVENAWIKGVLDASLHGAALLDLGIKQDPEAVTKYPWAIKKESTDETLPTGTSMLKIFDFIGMGRSLLILGAPGSGKTTMLLELARQLIARAREDVTYPIPMVFNLASWTEKLTLADWLAQELNNLYSIPRKTAPDWVSGNKLLLLLDGLDEVRQESRAKCVEAINAFRKEHGLTSLAVCSRSQDYADLNAKLSFEGAIEVQLLTQEQIAEFFNRFEEEMTGIKQALEKDNALREMAETPLFLSIMLMAYRDKRDVEILISGDGKAQRKHLFDTYIGRMFERPRSKNVFFEKQVIIRWLSWIANKMIEHKQMQYLLEDMKTEWLGNSKLNTLFKGAVAFSIGALFGFSLTPFVQDSAKFAFGLTIWLMVTIVSFVFIEEAETADLLVISRNEFAKGFIVGFLTIGTMLTIFWVFRKFFIAIGLFLTFLGGVTVSLVSGLRYRKFPKTTYPNQKIIYSMINSVFIYFISFVIIGVLEWSLTFISMIRIPLGNVFLVAITAGLVGGLYFGGLVAIQHYTLRFILARNNLLPWRLVPFLDHCVDLIFLRRVGGGYIFVHRLLMEHFAEMYVEPPTSKGNQK